VIELTYRREDGSWGEALGVAVGLDSRGTLRLDDWLTNDGDQTVGSSVLGTWETNWNGALLRKMICPEARAGQRHLALRLPNGKIEIRAGADQRLLTTIENGLTIRFHPLGIDLAESDTFRGLGIRFLAGVRGQPPRLLYREREIEGPIVIASPDHFDPGGEKRLAALIIRPGLRSRVSALAERMGGAQRSSGLISVSAESHL
jgi:hypothetical protein